MPFPLPLKERFPFQNTEMGKLYVLLGNGWYKSRFGFTAKEDVGFYGDWWKLIASFWFTDLKGKYPGKLLTHIKHQLPGRGMEHLFGV